MSTRASTMLASRSSRCLARRLAPPTISSLRWIPESTTTTARRLASSGGVVQPQTIVTIDNDNHRRRSYRQSRRRAPFSTSSAATTASQESTPSSEPKTKTTTTTTTATNKNIFQRLFEKHSMSKQTNRILMAESLFQAATTQASDPRWYGPGRIGRDFRSYQAILTMHIWFLHKRLVSVDQATATTTGTFDPHTAALIQEELFDILWIDTSNRMRAHGVSEMLIQKNLKKVQQYTFMHMFHYDHCYTADELLENPSDRLEALKMTIKTHVLLLPSLTNDDEPDEAKIETEDDEESAVVDEEALRQHVERDDQAERIAWYVETQFQNILHDLPVSFFEKARVAWVDLPSFDRMIDGNTGEELPMPPLADEEEILPPKWTKSIANDGTYYYWNLDTRQAQWDRPEGTTTTVSNP